MSFPTQYEVPVTTDASVTAVVVVVADSIEQASDKALAHVRANAAVFALDEDSIHCNEAYLPDPCGGTEAIESPLTKRAVDEALRGVTLVIADADRNNQAVFVNGRFIQSANRAKRESTDDLQKLAKNLADAMGVTCKAIQWTQDSADWSWEGIAKQLNEDAPATAWHLTVEYARFCRAESLPNHSVEVLSELSLTETQKAWLDRHQARWDAVVGS